MKVDEEMIIGPSELVGAGSIKKSVYQLYRLKTEMCSVTELEWSLFRKEQAKSDRLPPTQVAFQQTILRAHERCGSKSHPVITREICSDLG